MRRRLPDAGQAMVEFAIAITVFLTLLMGIVDLGTGIYIFNGVSEAAREIARVTSVHPGATLGGSAQTAAVVATQQSLVPNLRAPTFTCVDIQGNRITGTCTPGDWVKVTVVAPFTPVTGRLLGLFGFGTFNLQSSSTVEIQ